MRPRQRCVKCGDSCDPDVVKYRHDRGMSTLCKRCHAEDLSQRRLARTIATIKSKKDAFRGRKCVVCGREIPWKDSYVKKTPANWPVTCCKECHAKRSGSTHLSVKDDLLVKLRTAITELGPEAGYTDIIRKAHVSWKALHRHGILLSPLIKEVFGVSVSRYKYARSLEITDNGITIAELKAKYSDKFDTLADFVHNTTWDRSMSVEDKRARVVDAVRALITEQHKFIGVVTAMELLDISHDALRTAYKVDVLELDRAMGYEDKRRSWFESTAYELLVGTFGVDAISREHTFVDCVSEKGFPLRFDFYIPSLKVLIEVDGNQHKDKKCGYYKASNEVNDAIKTLYASQHGLTLYRIGTAPSLTFVDRFKSILGVLKPVELLEPRKGNQQPSSSNGEGSETIEKSSNAN